MLLPNEALKKLMEGNERFANGNSLHPNRCHETKNALLKEQKPYVAILSCSDSRVPTEIIFDAGLGDIFAVRTAGHVLSKEVLGSLEYAVKNLGVKLIMIMGHANCGAITQAVTNYKNQRYNLLSENIQSILNHIYPAIENIKEKENEDNFVEQAIDSNIIYQVEDLLQKDDYIFQKNKSGEIMVVGAKYSLSTGEVKILSCAKLK